MQHRSKDTPPDSLRWGTDLESSTVVLNTLFQCKQDTSEVYRNHCCASALVAKLQLSVGCRIASSLLLVTDGDR